MDVTAVTNSVTNSSVKRSCSATAFNGPLKSKRRTSLLTQINVREYFSHARPFADVKIKFDRDIIWCDKALLAAASPVLCEELLKMNSKEDVLPLEDVRLEEFLLLLEFIYPIFNPEINQYNISCLIKLSHRFQFEVLQHACRFYVMQYLRTVRRVSSQSPAPEVEGDCLISNYGHNDENEIESSKQHDLIEFHDGTCINASGIVLDLCQWLETYFYEENTSIAQSTMAILQQVSVKNLARVLQFTDINDDIKAYIYKERAQYLEEIHQIKHIV